MKKLSLIFILMSLSLIGVSQKFVIQRVNSDSISFEAKQIINSVNTQFDICKNITDKAKFLVDSQSDSLQYENVWNGYLTQLNNLRLTVIDQFRVSDTTQVTQIGDEYYLNGDTLGLSIGERKLLLKNRYLRLVTKYGQDKVDGDKKGVAIRDEYNLLIDYEKQLK
jgi:hypothetical protein